MGRHAGYIALNVGIASGAEVIILPERPFDFNKDIIKPILEGRNRGKTHYIARIPAGFGGAVSLAEKIEEITGIETTATILGHIQRGGTPTVRDRVMASIMGAKATELLANGICNQIIAVQKGEVVGIDIEEALETNKEIPKDMLELSTILSL